MTETIYWGVCPSFKGSLYLAAGSQGLCRVTLPNESFQFMVDRLKRQIPGCSLLYDQARVARYSDQLEQYLDGRRTIFTIPIDLRGTPFQVAVWRALLDIPFGTLRSYTDIAGAVGRPTAPRAIGAAIGANPVPIVVPCHRVIGKHGDLTGYRGGLELKMHLLELEKCRPGGYNG